MCKYVRRNSSVYSYFKYCAHLLIMCARPLPLMRRLCRVLMQTFGRMRRVQTGSSHTLSLRQHRRQHRLSARSHANARPTCGLRAARTPRPTPHAPRRHKLARRADIDRALCVATSSLLKRVGRGIGEGFGEQHPRGIRRKSIGVQTPRSQRGHRVHLSDARHENACCASHAVHYRLHACALL